MILLQIYKKIEMIFAQKFDLMEKNKRVLNSVPQNLAEYMLFVQSAEFF